MVDIDLTQFKKLYLDTAQEYAQKIEDNFSTLRDDITNSTAFNEVFVAAHSLKGQSLMMGYASIADASLALEKTYRSLKDGVVILNPELLDASVDLLAHIKESLQNIQNGETEKNLEESIASFVQKGGELH